MDHKSVSMVALFLALCLWLHGATAEHDYDEALTKSLLFFEAQRSGYLPSSQRVEWRANSGLGDGKINGVDLVGGYYDAGDNVKFGLPMAFTISMLCWSIIEYGGQLDESDELQNAIDAVKWGTDYFMKAHPQPNVLYGEVGDGDSDHYCWQRPEDMTTSRGAYKIDADHPGSDLAGETAAAMAAASIVFHRVNSSYSADLLKHAEQLFDFADKYRGKYDDSIFVAQKYYRSFSGFADELLWGAAWLYKATNKDYYLDYLGNNGDELGGTGWATNQFSWDVKYAGVQTLVAKLVLAGKGGKHAPTFERYKEKAELFICSCTARRTPGGLIYRQRWNNMQFVTTASFLMTVYSDYLASSSRSLACADGPVSPLELLTMAKSQVDYILGDNPREISYMVGYGKNYPLQVHHRAASIVSYKVDPSFVSCREGYGAWFDRNAGNPNILTGALVGGPDADDKFDDRRDNYEQTEPATYNTAPLVGVLARLRATHNWISIHQKVTTSWIEKGKTLYRYSGVVTNKSPKKVKNLKIRILNLYGPLWGLTKSGDYYFFPEWIDSLDAGHSIEFVYIHSGSEADISVLSYALV